MLWGNGINKKPKRGGTREREFSGLYLKRNQIILDVLHLLVTEFVSVQRMLKSIFSSKVIAFRFYISIFSFWPKAK